jgi:hypothetical protein
MGVTAVNVGDLDLMQDLTLLKQEASRGLSLISANLIDLSLGTPIPPLRDRIAVYMLVAIVKKQLYLDLSLYTILQIVSVTAFSIIQSQESEKVICNQLTLFD